MPLKLSSPPSRICVLRLSALGDACHVLPVIRTLQHQWPEAKITWIIGKNEARLMSLVSDVEFITFDKRHSIREYFRLRNLLKSRRFDLLLHMQLAIRASLLSSLVRAPIKVGFDRERARELQWLFTTHRIAPRAREHVLDSFYGFAELLGAHDRIMRWDIPLPDEAYAYAARIIDDHRPTLVVSPCSSHERRNWRVERYAAVIEHAVRGHGLRVVLCGGPSATEQAYGRAIERLASVQVINQIGKDTLPELLALLEKADVVISPDAGPAHLANAVGTPVIGLYAATNPERSGPYFSRQWCVNKYDEAARRFLGRPADELAWHTKIERKGVMDLITSEDVNRKLDEFMRKRTRLPRRTVSARG
jgi:heptosyltransferase I